jgi:hypothetical protein
MEVLAGLKFCSRESRVVWRIGKVLRLEAQGCSPAHTHASFPFDRSVEKISGVKLNAGLGG